MLPEAKNRLLTQVGAGTPMGDLLRRYWMPVAGVSQFDEATSVRAIRLLGEDLVLYRDLEGKFGLVNRHCTHRGADLSYGMVERDGIRCSYHGWKFGPTGECIEQPFEDTFFAERPLRRRPGMAGYPVEVKGGLVWAYMGPQPAPLVPDWEQFSWENGFAQIVISEIPCNWFQCQENSIDPVHFEWMHDNWGARLRDGPEASDAPRHLKLDFEEFEHGFLYKRIREDGGEKDTSWTVGRVCLWPNAFFLGSHFEWRVPVDDENTLSITWHFTHVPKEREPYRQAAIPTWIGPTHDSQGRWITSHVMNQDFIGWVGQGRIADRTKEHLGISDKGIVMVRNRFFAELEAVAAGAEPKGLIRDPAKNVRIELPSVRRRLAKEGLTTAEILANPVHKQTLFSYVLQAGQPDWVKKQFSEAMGVAAEEYRGPIRGRQFIDPSPASA